MICPEAFKLALPKETAFPLSQYTRMSSYFEVTDHSWVSRGSTVNSLINRTPWQVNFCSPSANCSHRSLISTTLALLLQLLSILPKTMNGRSQVSCVPPSAVSKRRLCPFSYYRAKRCYQYFNIISITSYCLCASAPYRCLLANELDPLGSCGHPYVGSVPSSSVVRWTFWKF